MNTSLWFKFPKIFGSLPNVQTIFLLGGFISYFLLHRQLWCINFMQDFPIILHQIINNILDIIKYRGSDVTKKQLHGGNRKWFMALEQLHWWHRMYFEGYLLWLKVLMAPSVVLLAIFISKTFLIVIPDLEYNIAYLAQSLSEKPLTWTLGKKSREAEPLNHYMTSGTLVLSVKYKYWKASVKQGFAMGQIFNYCLKRFGASVWLSRLRVHFVISAQVMNSGL